MEEGSFAMDVMEAIHKRRSIRHYRPDDIPDNVLNRLLNAMRLAPSGKNCQPWKFVVVRDASVKSQVAAACNWRTADSRLISQAWVDEAPVIIVACGLEQEAAVRYYKDGQVITANWAALEAEMAQGPIEYESAMDFDLAIALDHLTLAAAAEGLGTCWIGGLDEPQLKEVLSIPEDVRAPLVMVVGYPVAWPDPRPRKPLDEIVCYDQFS
jgi:nitroreductase